jgi:hypothetical protein
MGMFDGASLLAASFCSASNAAHAAFTALFSLRRLYRIDALLDQVWEQNGHTKKKALASHCKRW